MFDQYLDKRWPGATKAIDKFFGDKPETPRTDPVCDWKYFGSSYLPGELVAAFLWAQMEEADAITKRRLDIWRTYHQWFELLEARGLVRRPVVPGHCVHNAHMYYVPPDLENAPLLQYGYTQKGGHPNGLPLLPLDTAPMGQRCGSRLRFAAQYL